jgi:hypothetical protein
MGTFPFANAARRMLGVFCRGRIKRDISFSLHAPSIVSSIGLLFLIEAAMKTLIATMCVALQVTLLTASLSFVFPTDAKADECQKAPKSPRQKCLKAAYNWCNPGNGQWDNPRQYEVPPGPKDTCPK